jgi:hypothetical protein
MNYNYNDFFFNRFANRSRGALVKTKAEIIPVEPDQDNACAGKENRFFCGSFPVFVNPVSLKNKRDLNKNR